MTDYRAPTTDMQWLLNEVLQAPAVLQTLPCHAEVEASLIAQVLDEAGKFVSTVIAPLNQSGDATGCQWQDGNVRTPAGFRAAYQAFWQAGWPALSAAEEHGGQGLPGVLEAMLYEMLSAANHAWTMAPGLLHGAYTCIRSHGSDALRQRYLPRLASGEWLATMCLTEPQAGSDLGLVRTRALAQADGSFLVGGTKIFISGGEHDLSDNIVHLVLARLPDAPPGPKGLSLFLVPKFDEQGLRTPVVCERIEEKMGLHGSATCVMRFDDAPGQIIGAPGRGLQAMFVMMNAARLHVALQGIGLLEAAWQKASAYALERRQMRAPLRVDPAAAADPIAAHPAMRRILDTQRAWIDGGRVLAYRTALELDVMEHHTEAPRRAQAQQWCSLVTPAMKAAFTRQAFDGSSDCLQVFGGHGYVREWGIEQHVRDARVAMIYEGTNEIQAIDLLVRKVLADQGAALSACLQPLRAALDCQDPQQARVLAQLDAVLALSAPLCAAAGRDPAVAYWVADDYLRVLALVLLDWAWAQIGRCAPADSGRWSQPAQALQRWIMPELNMRLGIIRQAIE